MTNDNCDLILSSQSVAPDAAWLGGDCDSDGLTNTGEVDPISGTGTDPFDNDTDGDGNPDGMDPSPLTPMATDDNTTGTVGALTTFNILDNDDYLPNNDVNNVGDDDVGDDVDDYGNDDG